MIPSSPLLPESSYSATEDALPIPPSGQTPPSTTAQSQSPETDSNQPNPHPPKPQPHTPFPGPNISESSQGGYLMNQIPRMGFTQPLDFGFPTPEILYQGNEYITPLTTFFRFAKVVHWRTFKVDFGI
jgi:hypothetical protein